MFTNHLKQILLATAICLAMTMSVAPTAHAEIGLQLPSTTDHDVLIYEPDGDAVIEVVATAIPYRFATCPTFVGGTRGAGPAVSVDHGDYFTLCVSARNVGPRVAHEVSVSLDDGTPLGDVGSHHPGEERTITTDIAATASLSGTTLATATGTGYYLLPLSDTDPVVVDMQPPEMNAIGHTVSAALRLLATPQPEATTTSLPRLGRSTLRQRDDGDFAAAAVDLDRGAIWNSSGCIGRRHNTRQAKFATHDDGVTDLAADVNDDTIGRHE